MKHTKNILKSLLITVMALSLLAVSCKKDEGGSKPTDPTPKNSEALLTDILRKLGPLGSDTSNPDVDFSKMTEPASGKATISGANKTYATVKTALANVLKTENFQNKKIVLTAAPSISDTKPNASKALSVELIFKANADYTFDDSIIKGTAYTYNGNQNPATAKLTLEISPATDWE
ncbi:hypothetical protein [uncultured Brachyspira sp.]|uniref:hypothetical protein n=1 Tax=uncultured Brachyspira sp. TaxID=221953 RepID=UPI0025942BBB|nr:hypothetical protein [uncultured Brachyspira sp.]